MSLETLTALGLLAASFAATNFDNLALLTSWLVARRGHPRLIFAGHLLGMSAVLALSYGFGAAASLVPSDWIGWLGVIPIGIGLMGLRELYALRRTDSQTNQQALPTGGLMFPLSIAMTQVANGVDTVLVFGPLFADSKMAIDFVILGGFVAMTFVWFGLARILGRHATRFKLIERYGQWIAPIVMIAVGFYILADTGTDVFADRRRQLPSSWTTSHGKGRDLAWPRRHDPGNFVRSQMARYEKFLSTTTTGQFPRRPLPFVGVRLVGVVMSMVLLSVVLPALGRVPPDLLSAESPRS